MDTVAEICRAIKADPDIDSAYKDSITYGKASDFSVRKVGDVLAMRAEWEAFKAARAADGRSEFFLRLVEEMDLAVHEILDRRIDYYTADEKL